MNIDGTCEKCGERVIITDGFCRSLKCAPLLQPAPAIVNTNAINLNYIQLSQDEYNEIIKVIKFYAEKKNWTPRTVGHPTLKIKARLMDFKTKSRKAQKLLDKLGVKYSDY